MKTIKAKLIFTVISIFIVMMIATLVTGILSARYSIKVNVQSDLVSMGNIADIAISEDIDLLKKKAEDLANDLVYLEPGTEADTLSYLADAYTDYQSLSVVSADGTVTSSDLSFTGSNILEKDYFQSALTGYTSVSSTEYDDSGNLVINVCAAIPNGYSFLLLRLDGQHFSNIIKDIVVGETGNVFMIDSTGTMIANKRPELVQEQQNFIEMAKTDSSYEGAAAVYTKMTQGESGVDEYAYETGNRICAFGPVSSSDGWSYGVVAPIKEMTSTVSYTIISLCVVSLLVLILAFIAIITYANRLTKPIEAITNRIVLLSNGDLGTSVEVASRRDEVGLLASSTAETIETLRQYIRDIQTVLTNISNGDLRSNTEAEFKGEFIALKHSIDSISASLNDALMQIASVSNQVASGAEQVSSGAQALSQGATQQASAVEQLAATISEISQSAQNNAKNSAEVIANSEQAGAELQSCIKHMDNMISAMEKMSASSSEIGKIIAAIESIAFQTNILALNAAVEAARAGEAGKGFAVVADEVRDLASKSDQAAKATKELIESSIASVKEGNEIVKQVSESLDRTGQRASLAIDGTREIADAVEQEAQSIAQVTDGIEQISSVIQTNSATSEQSAAASEELSSQAQLLKNIISHFKLKSIGGIQPSLRED